MFPVNLKADSHNMTHGGGSLRTLTPRPSSCTHKSGQEYQRMMRWDPQSLEGRSLDKFELGMLQAPVFAAWLSEDCFTHFGQRPKNRMIAFDMETELILPEVGKN